MKALLSVIVVLSFSAPVLSSESVSVPWAEFKKLYTESIVRNVMAAQPAALERDTPFVYTLDNAFYSLTINKSRAQGRALLSGRIISGSPEPIALFGTDMVLARTDRMAGGHLLIGPDDTAGIRFLPDGKKEFQIEISFLVRPQEDSSSMRVAFAVPHALQNVVSLEMSPDTTLLEQPGIADDEGRYHLPATRSLEIRFRDKQDISPTSLVDVNTLSCIRMQGKRAVITTTFAPVRPMPASCLLRIQEGAQYIASSLKSSWIKEQGAGLYDISMPAGEKAAFSLQFAVDELDAVGGFSVALPRLQGNNGKEGDFVLEEPDDAQIRLSGKGLRSDIPIAKLAAELAAAAGSASSYSHIPAEEAIGIDVQRFVPVSTPSIVLDSQYFFASFEENGNVLSVLAADIPPDVGPRLKLKAIQDAEIWSLTVNGRRRKVYTNDEALWIIPLDGETTSHIELALLQKGSKLGLQGRLEASLPSTGLPSRTVCVGIALPERVRLLSMEGPVSPAPGAQWQTPVEFIGKPYFFSRSFYKGQGMALAISYKEPVEATRK